MAQTSSLNGAFEGRVVGSISGNFVVPGYQRGYRWGRPEVQRLHPVENAVVWKVDDFVLRNLDEQIEGYRQVSESMKGRLNGLPVGEQREVEQAAAIPRCVRAGDAAPRP